MNNQTEQSLSAIFAHCRAVQAGERRPMPPEVAQEQVRLFLGLKSPRGRGRVGNHDPLSHSTTSPS
jgi:hypothetical protein